MILISGDKYIPASEICTKLGIWGQFIVSAIFGGACCVTLVCTQRGNSFLYFSDLGGQHIRKLTL